MADKILELVEKMYIEFSQKFEAIDDRFDEMGKEIKRNRDEIKKVGATIDDEVTPKIDALFDGYKQNHDQITEIKHDVKELSCKVDKQEVEIKVIKNVQ